jgi:DNA-directed RNA polymerase subunit beta'
MLMAIDLRRRADHLREELKRSHQVELKPKKIIKRLKIVESFLESATARNG